MRQAFLTIIDDIHFQETNVTCQFHKFTTYARMLQELPKIYPKYKKEYKVVCNFKSPDLDYTINDLNSYILPGDHIDVILTKTQPIYVLYDVIDNCVIFSSNKISDVYSFYINEIYYNMDGEYLIYKRTGIKEKLIDVLDCGQRYRNQCINRLVNKYNY